MQPCRLLYRFIASQKAGVKWRGGWRIWRRVTNCASKLKHFNLTACVTVTPSLFQRFALEQTEESMEYAQNIIITLKGKYNTKSYLLPLVIKKKILYYFLIIIWIFSYSPQFQVAVVLSKTNEDHRKISRRCYCQTRWQIDILARNATK